MRLATQPAFGGYPTGTMASLQTTMRYQTIERQTCFSMS
jgi:hypothetical protein